jgi:osmoprotectant transport system permease protein
VSNRWRLLYILLLGALFVLLMSFTSLWELVLGRLFPAEQELIYPRAGLLQLVGEHLLLVTLSSLAAITAGVGIGIFVTRRAGREFLEPVADLTSLAQTFPPVAILALAVSSLGFGWKPTVVALFLYSILPILRNTVSGLEAVAPEVLEAARGMGMTPGQRLVRIELPLALPVILAGIRISVVINVGTATIGAVIGAGGLGTPIIAGLVRENPALVLQGALAAALLAFSLDQLIAQVEKALAPAAGRRAGR